MKDDEFEKAEFIMCLVFGVRWDLLYQFPETLNTKYQTLNTKHFQFSSTSLNFCDNCTISKGF